MRKERKPELIHGKRLLELTKAVNRYFSTPEATEEWKKRFLKILYEDKEKSMDFPCPACNRTGFKDKIKREWIEIGKEPEGCKTCEGWCAVTFEDLLNHVEIWDPDKDVYIDELEDSDFEWKVYQREPHK